VRHAVVVVVVEGVIAVVVVLVVDIVDCIPAIVSTPESSKPLLLRTLQAGLQMH
jgi:hypothetical protein